MIFGNAISRNNTRDINAFPLCVAMSAISAAEFHLPAAGVFDDVDWNTFLPITSHATVREIFF